MAFGTPLRSSASPARTWLAALVLVALPLLLLVPFHPEAFLVFDADSATPWWAHALVWALVEWGGNVIAFTVFAIALSVFVRSPFRIAVIAALVSVCSELAQTVIPNRVSSLHDVVLNTTGGILGAALVAVARAVKARSRA